jgi:transcriptional regulator with XRE-family HTH domain
VGTRPGSGAHPESSDTTLGAYIRAQRRLADLSVRQLAEMSDISNAYLSQLERGLHQPSLRVLRSIGRGLGIPTQALVRRAVDAGDAGAVGGAGSAGSAGGAGGVGDATGDAPDQQVATRDAILADPALTDRAKQALLVVYNSLRDSHD